MKKATLALTLFLTVASVLSQATAQDYDDDLYYSPSRAAKEQKKQAQEIQRRRDEAVRQAASSKPISTTPGVSKDTITPTW